MMEINRAGWIYEMQQDGLTAQDMFSGLKKVWLEMYRNFSLLTYRFSDCITTLFRDNSLMQIEAGADPRKIVIIPNGIDPDRFKHIPDKSIEGRNTFVVGLVGRVVAIKDIKTFIWSARYVLDKMPNQVKFQVMGAYDEESEYADECFALTSLLALEPHLEYTGKVTLEEAFLKTDIVVLTSISEGQPLSLMEAMSAGIPSVSTNVGACQELLYGKNEEDMQLGKAGFITNVHSSHETAEAIITILKDPDIYKDMSLTGKRRMQKYYHRDKVYSEYRKLLERMIGE
jgi:glycosyltransferase involved in cell wall biosynthesis